jgi:hypothetical protein
MTRKAIPDGTQALILLKSRRRCCLCYWLEGEDEVKKGQLAHLDGNNENAEEDNLAFLCLEHHDEYDSTPRVSKGLRENEVRIWRDELYKEMEYRFRTIVHGPLAIHFDETRHCFKENNKQCAMYRISVQNEGATTISNVSAKIVSIKRDQHPPEDDLRRFDGLRLPLSVNPFGQYSHPDTIPNSSVTLNSSEDAVFDFVRLCTLPGNFLVCHSHYIPNPHTSRLDHRPDPVLPPCKYSIIVSAQGDNLGPILACFEFWSTTTEAVFQCTKITGR